DFPAVSGFVPRFTASYEWQSPLSVHATPVTGSFQPTVPVNDYHATRYSFEVNRAPTLWLFGTELTFRAEARTTVPYVINVPLTTNAQRDLQTGHAFVSANIERPFGGFRLVTATTGALMGTVDPAGDLDPAAELVYLGGPVSAPGYDYPSLVTRSAFTEHLELRIPAPFIPFSLGRFGRVPARGSIAPFAHVVGASHYQRFICVPPLTSGVVTTASVGAPRFGCEAIGGWYPSFGAAYITPFDLLRFQVARGTGRGGRWTFNVDVSRDFWSIM